MMSQIFWGLGTWDLDSSRRESLMLSPSSSVLHGNPSTYTEETCEGLENAWTTRSLLPPLASYREAM